MLREAIEKLIRHSAVYGLAEQAGRLAAFLLIKLHTTYLPSGEYGTNALLGTSIMVFTHLAGVNIHNAMTRFYFEQPDEERRRLVVSTSLLSAAGMSVILAALLFAGQGAILRLIPSDYAGLAVLFHLTLGIFVAQMVKEVLVKYLQARRRSLLFAGLQLGKLGLEIALQVWFLAGKGMGVEGLFLAVLIGEAAMVVVLAALVLPQVGLRFSPPLFLALAAFTLPLIPNGLLQWCLHQGDRFLLGWLSAGRDAAVGIYDLAYKLGQIPNFLVLGPFLLIWYPYVFSLGAGEGGLERQRTLCGRLAPYVMLVMSAVVLGVSLLAHDLVALMAGRPDYLGAAAAVPLICAGYWFWALFQLLQTGFYVTKATGRLPWLTGAAAVLNVLLNLALIPRFGYRGAALATVLTFAGLCVITGRAVRPVFPVAWPWRRVLVPAAAGLVVVLAASTLPLNPGLASVLIRLSAWGLWAGWVWWGFLTGDERQAALETLAGLLRRRRERSA